MKTMNKTLTWLIAAVLTLTLVSANAENGKQRTGKVVRIKGDARYSTGNKIWQPLKVGAIIKSGNVVQTAPNSFVDIVINEEETAAAVVIKPISAVAASSAASSGGGGGVGYTPDHDVVRVLDDTYLVFDSLTATESGTDTATETLLDLKKGSIFGSVKKQAAASRFEVKIPNGVAGIRGTTFLISASGNIACLIGSVVAAYTAATGDVNTQVVGAGNQFSITTGQGSALEGAMLRLLNELVNQTAALGIQTNVRRGHGPGPHHHPGSDHVSKHKPSSNNSNNSNE
jgi:hypothetical protein